MESMGEDVYQYLEAMERKDRDVSLIKMDNISFQETFIIFKTKKGI